MSEFMALRSRAKGVRYERNIARRIRDALDLERHDCWRTPLSGGHPHDSKINPGDLQFSPPLRAALNVAIECKHHDGASLHPLLAPGGLSPRSYWARWLDQTSRLPPGPTPCLVARVKRLDLVVMPAGSEMLPRVPPRLTFRHGGTTWSLAPLPDVLNVWKAELARHQSA